ncbi:MAG TPA: PHP domain-containing protein [Desulfitobacteriaceae bacterium]|nr:PHP domain-containing protein [Desulfitobacteriaceae bacterium]
MKPELGLIPEADLHCHTTASDGILTPGELVKLASERGLKAIAVTDHDTISGWSEAEISGSKFGLVILRGVELNTVWEDKEVHILGYQLDSESIITRERLAELQLSRSKRIREILDKLKQIDIKIRFEDVLQFSRGESIGRPHVGQALVKHGYVTDIQEAFVRFLGLGAPAYVPRFKLDVGEGIRFIRESKGVAVLAHPGLQRLKESTIASWVKEGLQGLEVFHSDHNSLHMEFYGKIARQHNLIITGGSDFHGDNKPNATLGKWGVSMDVVRQIKELGY